MRSATVATATDSVKSKPLGGKACFAAGIGDAATVSGMRQVRRWIALWARGNLVPSPPGIGRAGETMQGPA